MVDDAVQLAGGGRKEVKVEANSVGGGGGMGHVSAPALCLSCIGCKRWPWDSLCTILCVLFVLPS